MELGIEKCAMHNEKWKKRNKERNRTAQTGNHQNAWRKRKL